MYWYIYFLKSYNFDFTYVGSTNDLKRRIKEHNSGMSKSTSKYKPFFIAASIAVRSEHTARNLEKYFKTGSGKAFLNKRILVDETLV